MIPLLEVTFQTGDLGEMLWRLLILILIIILVALLLSGGGILPVGDKPGEGEKKPTEPLKTQEKKPEEKPPTPTAPPPEEPKPTANAPQKLAEPCLCPCPVGVKAKIKIQEDVTPLKFNLTKDEQTISVGLETKFESSYDEKTIKVPYDFHDKDRIGMGNDGNVNLTYKLFVYYAAPPPKECCESGTISFKGTVTFSGSYKPIFRDKVTVRAKSAVEGKDSFDKCTKGAKEQCKVTFTGKYQQGFSFSVPSNPLPGLKSWDDSSVSVDGDFTTEIVTKKTP